MKKRKQRKDLAFVVLILILVAVMLYSGLRILESTVLYPASGIQDTYVTKTVTRDGVSYFPRQDITVILIMGIDEEGTVESSNSYRNSGEADVVALAILDQADESYSLLCLNRDMMLEMPALGIGGRQAGTFYGQLALSHTYGSGLEDSAENTRTTVSDFLYGLHIDYYVAMNMDAISILNDAVGGVTVNVTDDFSLVDPTIQKGIMTLSGEQAMYFVRSRYNVGTQMNISRMERHVEYMSGLAVALTDRVGESADFAADLYEQLSPYVVTDCSSTTLSSYLQRCSDYTLKEIASVAGENVLGEEYYEFYADPDALDALILRLFYAPKT